MGAGGVNLKKNSLAFVIGGGGGGGSGHAPPGNFDRYVF